MSTWPDLVALSLKNMMPMLPAKPGKRQPPKAFMGTTKPVPHHLPTTYDGKRPNFDVFSGRSAKAGLVPVMGVWGGLRTRGIQQQWDCTDTKAKNILWKAPAPGWGMTHPIVVGKRVFAVGNPDVVACYVLDSGKVLWQKRISPAFLDGVPEAQAKGVQVAVDLVLALTKGYRCTNPGFALTFGTVYGGVPVLHRREVTWKGRADP